MLQLVELDTRGMEGGIRAVLASAETRSRTFFQSMKPGAKEELKQRKKERRGPDGQPWAPRSRTTIKRGRRGSKTRRRNLLGKVATAYKWTADNDGLVGKHRVRWGAVHHQGGVVGRGSRLPARPFAGFSDSFSDKVRAAWLAWTGKDW